MADGRPSNLPEIHTEAGKPFAATWLLDAPWAHPVWSQYTLFVYDLTTPTAEPPIVYLNGATHEMLLFALDPAHRVDPAQPASRQKIAKLHPANAGYQFRAASDEAAVERLQQIVDAIEARRLSPDTDFRSVWDRRFADGCSLLRRRL